MNAIFQPLDAEMVGPVLARCNGNITLTAIELGVNSARLRAYVRAKPELLAIQAECKGQLLDKCEENVRKALYCAAPNMRDQAAKFVLGAAFASGRIRKFGENVIDIRTRQPLIITWIDESDKEAG